MVLQGGPEVPKWLPEVLPRRQNGHPRCSRGAKMAPRMSKRRHQASPMAIPRSQKGPAAEGVALKIFSGSEDFQQHVWRLVSFCASCAHFMKTTSLINCPTQVCVKRNISATYTPILEQKRHRWDVLNQHLNKKQNCSGRVTRKTMERIILFIENGMRVHFWWPSNCHSWLQMLINCHEWQLNCNGLSLIAIQ